MATDGLIEWCFFPLSFTLKTSFFITAIYFQIRMLSLMITCVHKSWTGIQDTKVKKIWIMRILSFFHTGWTPPGKNQLFSRWSHWEVLGQWPRSWQPLVLLWGISPILFPQKLLFRWQAVSYQSCRLAESCHHNLLVTFLRGSLQGRTPHSGGSPVSKRGAAHLVFLKWSRALQSLSPPPHHVLCLPFACGKL